LLAAPACYAQDDSLERGLLRQAPKMIKYFKQHGYKNVGVLKFLVSRESKGFSDNVGTFNLLAARRLELALILANDPNAPVGITANASEVARKIDGASHLSKEGREKLFAGKYPLAWGKGTVQPDAFVTGATEISSDLRTLNVSLFCFDRAANKFTQFVKDFKVNNSIDRLAEEGESFVMRGAFDDGLTEVVKAKNREQVFQEAVMVHKEQTKHPGQWDNLPVTLEVRYDGRKIPFAFKNGKAYISEPLEGQTVELLLNRDKTRNRYAVVLKVNGENTLEKERVPDLTCYKWVLDPGYGPWAIRGFHVGDTLEKFRVASISESKLREVNYGHDVGTITMTVFREQKGKAKPMLILDDEAAQHTVVQKLTELPRKNNYGALVAQLLDDANRGLIVEGQREPSKVETVRFVADPDPIMCLTVVYRK
jgi:hypothetical protein